ncbi:MAG: hypothetical protein MUE75_07030 [Algoriphagus sp.]|jgi:hypothetical protein|nr:hypothetical protein [Algoriphagus sp.]
MPKGLLHIAYSLLILLNGMGYTIIQAQFLLHRKEITAIYCINKDKPELECEGKCELSKRLSEAKNKKGDAKEVSLEELFLRYIPSPLPIQVENKLTFTPEKLQTKFSFWVPSGESGDFFHPPTS